jgi:hypothetical protein
MHGGVFTRVAPYKVNIAFLVFTPIKRPLTHNRISDMTAVAEWAIIDMLVNEISFIQE